jgi:hypothetical protein
LLVVHGGKSVGFGDAVEGEEDQQEALHPHQRRALGAQSITTVQLCTYLIIKSCSQNSYSLTVKQFTSNAFK